ncbi:hypothetical protein NKJ40_07530 [Mesorhizobium sp. M0119]
MADDKSTRDRDRLGSSQDYDVEHFARQNGIAVDQVPELIRANDNDRAGVAEATKALRRAAGRSDRTAREIRQERARMHLGEAKADC